MKKFIFICIVCMSLFCVSVMADEISVKVTDIQNDIITVSGNAGTDELVTVLVLKPGKTLDSITYDDSEDSEAIQDICHVLSKNGAFSIDLKLETKNGGDFTAVAYVGDKTYIKTFTFYSQSEKTKFVSMLKDATDANKLIEKIEEIMEKFTLKAHTLYVATTPLDFCETIVAQNSKYTLTSPEDATLFLNEMLIVNAYNKGLEALVNDNYLSYADILGIDESDWYKDYTKSILSEKGISAVNEKMLSQNYEDISDIREAFFEQMCYHAIKNNSLLGSGHIRGLLTKYSEDYEKAGFDLSLLENEDGINTLMTSFLNSDAITLSLLAEDFNEIFAPEENKDGYNGGGAPAGGSHGGGSVQSGSVGAGFVSQTEQEPTISPSPENHSFKDMVEAKWAEEAISYLYKEGIVSGRSEDEFAPMETVTRAELVKMIVVALDIKNDGEKAFGDVNDTDWFSSYVYSALSAGIIIGDNGKFLPLNPITREDAAVIIYRAINSDNENSVSFSDADDISDYAKKAVLSLAGNKIISGMGDGSFKPKNTLTRAECAQLIYNIVKGVK